jgi:hypothetical protein
VRERTNTRERLQALSRLTTERIAESIFYLYGAGENYWFSPIASLNQEAEDRAKALSAAEVEAESRPITPAQGSLVRELSKSHCERRSTPSRTASTTRRASTSG